MDTLDGIIRYENGEMEEPELFEFFQHLIDSGAIDSLQGHYQRGAMRLIEVGICHLREGK